MGGDLRVARRRRQIIVPEQDLDDPDVGSVLEKMRREAVAQRVQRDALGQARSLHCRPAGGVQHGLIDRMIFVTPREQIKPRPGEPPVGAQDAKQLGRQHHVAILRPLAVAHLDDTAGAVDVFDPQSRDLGGPEPGRISGRERGAALQARHGLEELHRFVGAQHARQFEGLARVGNALRNSRLAKRDAVEKPYRADDLVQGWPRDARRNQMNLEGADVFQFQPIRRFAEIAAELRNRTDVGSLRRRRQITDGHVLDHATAQRAHCGHLETSCLGGGLQHPHPLRQEALHATSPFTPRQRLRSIVKESQFLRLGITYQSRIKDAYFYPNSAWITPFIGGSYKFEQNGALNLDAKDLFFFYATGVTPAMTEKMVGRGSQYAGAFVDAKGNPLDGGKTYRLHMPPRSEEHTSEL